MLKIGRIIVRIVSLFSIHDFPVSAFVGTDTTDFPGSFRWRIIFFMPERDKPTAFINSDMLILGVAAISWRIFRSLFRLLLGSLSCNASFSSLLFSLLQSLSPYFSPYYLYPALFLKYFPPYFFVRLPVMLQIN